MLAKSLPPRQRTLLFGTPKPKIQSDIDQQNQHIESDQGKEKKDQNANPKEQSGH
jgi:hypothetical protein